MNVHRYSSTLKPAEFVGTSSAVMPLPSPAFPALRAKIKSNGALWMPVFQVFSPLMRQPLPSRTAVVSMCVASEPWFGSVMPNAKPVVPSSSPSTNCAFCASVP